MKEEKQANEELSHEEQVEQDLESAQNDVEMDYEDAEFITDDERFRIEETEEKKEQKKVFDNNLKKKIKKEQKLSNRLYKRKHFVNGVKEMVGAGKILRALDFVFNLFSIGAIIFSITLTGIYLYQGNPYMVVAGCVMTFITIYLNEKIS